MRALLAFTLAAMCLGTGTEVRSQAAAPEVHHIHGLVVDRRDPAVLLIATHTGLVRLRPNAAPEWVGSHRFDLMGFTAHPQEPRLVYASGHPDLPGYRQLGAGNLGLLVSRDGGATWQPVALKGEADFHALAYSPRDGGRLYGWSVAAQPGLYRLSAATWAVERLGALGLSGVLALSASPDPNGPLLAGTRTGLSASHDQGMKWTPVPAIPPDTPVTAVGHHATDPRMVYAFAARPTLGLLRSRDGGTTWESIDLALDPRTPAVALAVGPGDHVVIATTEADVLRSRDAGRTWQRVLAQGRPVAETP